MTDEFGTELSLRIIISPNSHTTQGLREKWFWIFGTVVPACQAMTNLVFDKVQTLNPL